MYIHTVRLVGIAPSIAAALTLPLPFRLPLKRDKESWLNDWLDTAPETCSDV